MMMESECLSCKEKNWNDILMIDFENNKIKGKCGSCGGINMFTLTPSAEIIKKGKKPELAQEDVEEENLINEVEGTDFIDEDNNKIGDAKKLTYKERKNINDDMFAVIVEKSGRKTRMFPMHDVSHVRNALARLPQATETLKKLDVSVETVKRKILKRAKELNMTDILKRHEKGGYNVEELLKKYNKATIEELSSFVDETLASLTAKEQEVASLKSEKETISKQIEESSLAIENAKLELEKVKAEFATVKEELDKRIVAEKQAFVKSRRDELGEEFSKELSDEDISNDLKFENAKLRKEISKIKQEKGSVASAGLEAGKTDEKVPEHFVKQNRIKDQAFGKDK